MGQEPEDDEHAEGSLDARIGEAQRRDPLVGDHLRPLHPGDGRVAEDAVVVESLDAEETSVGVEADLPQDGEVPQPL